MSDAEKSEKKRDMDSSSESRGQKAESVGNRFVIHKHDASNLHYDFRLEIDGTLKSWTVPKGPSTDPGDMRLMIETEDHPLEYAGFEGVIPEDEYGGGTLLIWDKGEYKNSTEKNGELIDLKKALKDGELSVELDGEKISGGYTIVKFRDEDQWLLIKMDDDYADARRNPTSTEPKSVASGRSLKQIKDEEKPEKPLDDQ